MNANSAEDWRIAITWQRALQIALEVMICALCPLPVDISFYWKVSDGDTVSFTYLIYYNPHLNQYLNNPSF